MLVYDENTWRPYCNVLDISDAIIKVLEIQEEKVFGQVFNVGSNQNNYTKKMIVGLIQKYIKNSSVRYKKGGFDPRNYRVSFEKAKKVSPASSILLLWSTSIFIPTPLNKKLPFGGRESGSK